MRVLTARQQRLAGDHFAGVGAQGGQQAEFGAGERHQGAVRCCERQPHEMEFPAAETVGDRFRVGGWILAMSGMAAGAAQQGADAGEQFAGGVGLHHVVVGAAFQADDAVCFGADGGEHEDGDAITGSQAAAE